MVRRSVSVASLLVVAVLAATTGGRFAQTAGRYREGQNLDLPGAELIRLPDAPAALMRLLAHNAAAHADMLFSLPGMFSFNVWADVPTPTHANVTHWFSLLDDSRQQAIIRELEGHPLACVIVHREHVKFLTGRGLAPRGPLYDYITRAFEPAFAIDDVEFCVHRGRKIEPFMIAALLARSDDASPATRESTLLKFRLLLPPRHPIARVELASSVPGGKPIVLEASTARVEFSSANVRGEPTSPLRPAAWPVALSGPSILYFYYDREAHPLPAPAATIVLRDAAGVEVGLARLQPQ